jgi:hypothetical protein
LNGLKPICKRNRDHTLSIGAASASADSKSSRLSQGGASARRVARADATRLGIHASEKDNRTKRDMRTLRGCAYIWWCSGDRLDGSMVPKDTMFCMSRSSTCSSIRGEWKGKLRLCFAYMSVIWSASSDMPCSCDIWYTSPWLSRPNELSGGDWLAMMGSGWLMAGIGEVAAAEWGGGPIGVCT